MKRFIKRLVVTSAILFVLQANIVFADTTFKEEQNVKIPKTSSITNMFPGESGTVASSNLEKITNANNFKTIVCLDFKANTKGYIDPSNPYLEPFRYQKDYDFTSEPGKILFRKRLSKVMTLEMNNGNEWVKIGDRYYTFVDADSEKELNSVVFSLLPELGGGMRTNKLYPERTFQRPWEQKSSFDLGYKLTIINADEDAVSENFGKEVLKEIKEQSSENWFN